MRSPIREPLSYFRYLGKNKAEASRNKVRLQAKDIYLQVGDICL